MQIQLSWIDSATGEYRQPKMETPLAMGREFAQMPSSLDGNRVYRIVLLDDSVSDYHALIDFQAGELRVIDQNSANGTCINGERLSICALKDGDRLQIGSSDIQINFTAPEREVEAVENVWKCDRNIGFLIRRQCNRTSRVDCPYCESESAVNNYPFFYAEHSYYPSYGRYKGSNWDRADFTDADSASLENFEGDMGAS